MRSVGYEVREDLFRAVLCTNVSKDNTGERVANVIRERGDLDDPCCFTFCSITCESVTARRKNYFFLSGGSVFHHAFDAVGEGGIYEDLWEVSSDERLITENFSSARIGFLDFKIGGDDEEGVIKGVDGDLAVRLDLFKTGRGIVALFAGVAYLANEETSLIFKLDRHDDDGSSK